MLLLGVIIGLVLGISIGKWHAGHRAQYYLKQLHKLKSHTDGLLAANVLLSKEVKDMGQHIEDSYRSEELLQMRMGVVDAIADINAEEAR